MYYYWSENKNTYYTLLLTIDIDVFSFVVWYFLHQSALRHIEKQIKESNVFE